MVVKRVPNAKEWGAVQVETDARGPFITNILGDGEHMFCGVHVTRPSVMLQAISDYRCMLTWMPNFAFEFLAQRVRPSQLGAAKAITLVAGTVPKSAAIRRLLDRKAEFNDTGNAAEEECVPLNVRTLVTDVACAKAILSSR